MPIEYNTTIKVVNECGKKIKIEHIKNLFYENELSKKDHVLFNLGCIFNHKIITTVVENVDDDPGSSTFRNLELITKEKIINLYIKSIVDQNKVQNIWSYKEYELN